LGAEQRRAFDKIKEHLTTSPVLRVPKIGEMFQLYVATQEHVIGVVLTQESNVKEFIVAYVSRRLLGAKARYAIIEKLCLSLYYECNKFRHYLLSSSCMVVCQHDIVKYMMHKLILSGRIGKWAYSLVAYELSYAPLQTMKGQVVADFIVDHAIEGETCLVKVCPWELHFDGSICGKGQGIGCVITSPNGGVFYLSARLEFACTNNQAEYEVLLYDLEYLRDMRVRDICAYGDSKLVVQQITGESQCLDGILNSYRDRCLDIVRSLDSFCIYHIPREKNKGANTLAQCASGYEVTTGMFIAKERLASRDTCNAESVEGELYLGVKEVGNGPASENS
jgi:ribonuclease HI